MSSCICIGIHECVSDIVWPLVFEIVKKIYSSFRPVANLGSQLFTPGKVLEVVVMRHNILWAVTYDGAAQF